MDSFGLLNEYHGNNIAYYNISYRDGSTGSQNDVVMKKGKKSSSGDNSFEHPYMIPERYISIARERLKSNLLSDNYRSLLTKQIEDCLKEIDKKTKEDLL